jgi:peptide/nickel transport system permease protein
MTYVSVKGESVHWNGREALAAVTSAAAPAAIPRRPGRLRIFGIPFLRVRNLVGAVLLAIIILGVVFGPFLVSYSPNLQNIAIRLQAPALSRPHLLGTDELGRDLLARILAGGRISLALALSGTALSALIGTTVGLIAGYRGGRTETVIMGVVDAHLAFPFILLAIAFVATIGPSVGAVLAVMVLSTWVAFARPVHALTLSLKGRDFVVAARGLGLRDTLIIRRHLLPHVVPTVVVVGTVQVAQLILFESALSFLGLGVPPSIPSWGAMLGDSRSYIQIALWTSLYPGLAIVLSVFSLSLVGDWVRELANPRD